MSSERGPDLRPEARQLAQQLREGMRQAKLTDRSAAELLGVATSTFSSWITARAPWRPDALYDLCAAIGVDAWEAADLLGVLPGKADALLLHAKQAATVPWLAEILGLKDTPTDPVGDVVNAVRAAGFDAVALAHHRGRAYRRPVQTYVIVLPRDGAPAGDGRAVRVTVTERLRAHVGTSLRWEENPALLPAPLREYEALIVEDVFGVPAAPDRPADLGPTTPILVGGIVYSGAKVMPHLLHEHFGLAAMDASAPFQASLDDADSLRHQRFVQEAALAEIVRFPPLGPLCVTADDAEALRVALRNLDGGQWQSSRGTFVLLAATESLRRYAAYHGARTAAAAGVPGPASDPEWVFQQLSAQQAELQHLGLRLYGARCRVVDVDLPATIRQNDDGTWPDEVDPVFDKDHVTAAALAELLDPGGAARARR